MVVLIDQGESPSPDEGISGHGMVSASNSGWTFSHSSYPYRPEMCLPGFIDVGHYRTMDLVCWGLTSCRLEPGKGKTFPTLTTQKWRHASSTVRYANVDRLYKYLARCSVPARLHSRQMDTLPLNLRLPSYLLKKKRTLQNCFGCNTEIPTLG